MWTINARTLQHIIKFVHSLLEKGCTNLGAVAVDQVHTEQFAYYEFFLVVKEK